MRQKEEDEEAPNVQLQVEDDEREVKKPPTVVRKIPWNENDLKKWLVEDLEEIAIKVDKCDTWIQTRDHCKGRYKPQLAKAKGKYALGMQLIRMEMAGFMNPRVYSPAWIALKNPDGIKDPRGLLDSVYNDARARMFGPSSEYYDAAGSGRGGDIVKKRIAEKTRKDPYYRYIYGPRKFVDASYVNMMEKQIIDKKNTEFPGVPTPVMRRFEEDKEFKQTKSELTVGAPGDRYEREADAVADRVMAMPDPALQRDESEEEEEPDIQMQPEEDEETLDIQSQIEEEEPVQMKGEAIPTVTPQMKSELNATRGGSEPLSAEVRSFMEPRFGRDFSKVRVHTGARAASLAKGLRAQAFTCGSDIYFGSGKYMPNTVSGKRLLAHELVHVIQQSHGSYPGGENPAYTPFIQRAEPVTTVTISAIAAKCMIGAIVGALFDLGVQSLLYSLRNKDWRFWKTPYNICSVILSAVLGCIASPISAYLLEPWIIAKLGPYFGGIVGTLLGKILLFIVKKSGMAIPKSIVGKLAKLGCISPEQATELGVKQE